MQKFRHYQLVIALIAVLAAGTTFATVRMHASAQTPPPSQGQPQRHGNGVFGTVSSASAGSFVLTDRSGKAVTVKTTAATKFFGRVAAKLTDIKAGDAINIMAQKAQDGSLSALAVQDTPAGLGLPPRGRGGVRTNDSGRAFVSGSVVSVNATSVSVASAAGAATTVTVPPTAHIRRTVILPASSLVNGARVAVMGTLNQDGTLTASTIMVQANKQ